MYEIDSRILTGDTGRWAEVRTWVPATPGRAWAEISTDHGISSWFIPDAVETVSSSQAPTATTGGHFTYAEHDWMGPGIPVHPWITTTTVAAAPDGDGTNICLRSGFDTDSDIAVALVDDSLPGWRQSFVVLTHRLTHYANDPSVTVLADGAPSIGGVAEVWKRTLARLRLSSDELGATFRCGDVAGIVADRDTASLIAVLSSPFDGVVSLFAYPHGHDAEGAMTHSALSVRAYQYGDRGPGSPEADSQHRSGSVSGVLRTWGQEQWSAWLTDLSRSS